MRLALWLSAVLLLAIGAGLVMLRLAGDQSVVPATDAALAYLPGVPGSLLAALASISCAAVLALALTFLGSGTGAARKALGKQTPAKAETAKPASVTKKQAKPKAAKPEARQAGRPESTPDTKEPDKKQEEHQPAPPAATAVPEPSRAEPAASEQPKSEPPKSDPARTEPLASEGTELPPSFPAPPLAEAAPLPEKKPATDAVEPDAGMAAAVMTEPPSTEAAPREAWSLDVTFAAGGQGASMLGSGWSAPEAWGVWSGADKAAIELTVPTGTTPGTYRVDLVVCGFVYPAQPTRRAEVRIGGGPPIETVVSLEQPHAVASALVTLAATTTTVPITFDIHDPISPKAAGLGEDTRTIGLGLISLKLTAA